MHDLQAAKAVVRQARAAIDAAGADDVAASLAPWCSSDYRWRGMYPYHELRGAEAAATQYWSPLKAALGPLQRRIDIFIAGPNQLDDGASVWVAEMGHLMGNWHDNWLGFAPSKKLGFLRYAEFHRIEHDRIVETAHYFDVLNFLALAGYKTVPELTGIELLTPGPNSCSGVLEDPQDPAEGRETVELIAAMVADLRGHTVRSPERHIDQFWTDDMCWFGPGGIGASAFKNGYRRGHAGPFERGLEYVRHTEHVCRIGEGLFGGFFGYPSLTMRSRGYLGLPASEVAADMRIVDLYRRDGDKLAENWIFIDLPYFFEQMGIDLLGQIRAQPQG